MGFYYFSFFGTALALLVSLITAGVFWFVWRGVLKRRIPSWAFLVSLPFFLVLPWAEELWIAWNFGQACKEAGTFIHKKVQVEGFYDETRTTHAGTPTPQAVASFEESGYRFFEMKGKQAYVRIEKHEGRWVTTTLVRPTARYHFRMTDPMDGTPWGHKIIRFGSVVFDTETNQEIARYIGFGRGAAWYFIGLDVPGFACDSPGNWPYTRKSRLIYREALIPAGQK